MEWIKHLVFLVLTTSCTSVKKMPEVPGLMDSSQANVRSSSSKVGTHFSMNFPRNISGEQALGWLLNGNVRYQKGKLRSDGQGESDRQHLMSKYQPHAIVLACSDARVPPEIIFDQKLGEIYVVRSAAESIDAAGLASIEFAIANYGINLIYVLGHNYCETIDSALHFTNGAASITSAIDALLKDVHSRLSNRLTDGAIGLTEESRLNAEGVANDLQLKSALILEQVKANRLTIKYGIYQLEKGKVTTY